MIWQFLIKKRKGKPSSEYSIMMDLQGKNQTKTQLAIIYQIHLYFRFLLSQRDLWNTNVNCVEQPMSRP